MATSIVRLGLESNEYEKGIRNAQKTWNDFTKSLGLNIGKISAVGLAIGAVTASAKAMKDAFFKNEQQLDEWGRIVKSSQSAYSAFLNSLNNGNVNGFLTNINSIVRAARQAYDALDELGTFNAFNQINQERARTGLAEAIVDYREGTGSKEAVQSSAATLKQELTSRQQREQAAYEAAVRSKAAERGISGDVLLRIMQGEYGTLEQYKGLGLSGTKTVFQSNGMFGGTTAVQVPTAANEQEKIGEALRQLNDTEIQDLQALGAQAQRTATEIASVDKQVARILGAGRTGGGAGGAGIMEEEYIPLAGSIDAQTQKVKELQDAFNAAGSDGIRMGLLPQLKEAEQTLERMKTVGGMGVDGSGFAISGTGMSAIPNPPTIDNSEMEEAVRRAAALEELAEMNQKEWQAAAEAISSVGQALSQVEDPAIKTAGIIAQAIATIAMSYAQAMKIAAETTGPWGWIAFAATGLSTMIGSISAIKQATAGSYAEGGIIPGNHYSGDAQWARVNAGELILNSSQQGTLASRLQQGSLPNNLHLETRIKGEDIVIALNNTGRRTLIGEFVTTNRRGL